VRIGSLFLRRVHKWIGLLIGLQFLLWTLSGAMMAVLDMEEVRGGPSPPPAAAPPLPQGGQAWTKVQQWVEEVPVTSLAVRPLLGAHVVEVGTPAGTVLFDAATGRRVRIDAGLARSIAAAAYPGTAPVTSVTKLAELTLPVRRHQLPIWRIDFADEANSSYYVSASTGKLLERRNDTWRLWDFFWMLHNMDYARRESFNHPIIIFFAFVTLWLAVTGLWLLFRTAWAPDLRALKRRLRRER